MTTRHASLLAAVAVVRSRLEDPDGSTEVLALEATTADDPVAVLTSVVQIAATALQTLGEATNTDPMWWLDQVEASTSGDGS